MHSRTLLCLSAVSILLPGALASDGAIPIFEPTTISESGLYVVTRPIVAAGPGPILTVEASALAVRLDLNGFLLQRTDTVGPVIDVEADASGNRPNLEILNGVIAGGSTGLNGGDEIILENVGFFDHAGIGLDLLNASTLIMSNCRVANTGQQGVLFGGGSSRIVDNLFRDTGNSGIEVVGNNTLIARNEVDRARKNGISVTGDANRVSGNLVTNAQESSPGLDGDGIYIEGSANLVEENQATGNAGFGLIFDSAAANVFRDNVLSSNAGGALVDPGNTDAGGNVL